MGVGRIYIRFGKDYNGYQAFDFDDLLKKVAVSVGEWRGKKLTKTAVRRTALEDEEVVSCCQRRTKKFIAEKATQLINEFGEDGVLDIYSMGNYVSQRQITRLERVCKHKGNELSCYSLVILHIIYASLASVSSSDGEDVLAVTTIPNNIVNSHLIKIDNNDFEILRTLDMMIFELANHILADHPNALVQYIVNVHSCVKYELEHNLVNGLNVFPPIHGLNNL